jgi:hypothetical protein
MEHELKQSAVHLPSAARAKYKPDLPAIIQLRTHTMAQVSGGHRPHKVENFHRVEIWLRTATLTFARDVTEGGPAACQKALTAGQAWISKLMASAVVNSEGIPFLVSQG